MTIKECYDLMGADFDDVKRRLMNNEKLVQKFLLKFLDDPSFKQLSEALEAGDGKEAFRAAHTLKGVCQNLGLTSLYEASFVITEKLRGENTEGCEDLMKQVETEYEKTISAIKMIQ